MERKNETSNKEDINQDNRKEQALQTIDDYILQAPIQVQDKLREIRHIIQEAAPNAKEKISWKMPTYDYYGNLVHFAANKNHIGFYPAESGVRVFKERLQEYKSSKGAVQFPYDQPLPHELIRDIVLYRLTENEGYEKERQLKKSQKKKAEN